jgi:acyl carrier protein
MKKSTKSRLIACFKQVFPNLTDKTVLSASEDTLGDWDSVRVVELVVAIEKEFGDVLNLEKIAELTSFDAFLEAVEAA